MLVVVKPGRVPVGCYAFCPAVFAGECHVSCEHLHYSHHKDVFCSWPQ